MKFEIKSFNELTTTELYAIYRARIDVFVVEQNCPYHEVDDADLRALHIWLTQDNQLAAYCRLILDADDVHIGRVLVVEQFRQHKLGRKLVEFALQQAQANFPNQPIIAQAQSYLQQFYGSFGFQTISNEYLEDGIPHIDMILKEGYLK